MKKKMMMAVAEEIILAAGAGLLEAEGMLEIHVRPEAVPAGIPDILLAGTILGIIVAVPEIAVHRTVR